MSQISLISSPAESNYHKIIKLLIYNQLYNDNKTIIERSLEKYFGKRFADVYFKFQDGREVVVEVQNSPISVQEIMQRTQDYNNLGLFVLWILHGQGKCVASYKSPVKARVLKISMAENYLYKMYGGRVYYINLDSSNQSINTPELFALYFIKPYKKSKQGLFKGRYAHFYYRDALYSKINDWKILCNEFAGNKIARFYDKNLKSLVKSKIKVSFHLYIEKVKVEKKVVKLIEKTFKKRYGQYLIYKCLNELYQEKQIKLSEKIRAKIIKKIS